MKSNTKTSHFPTQLRFKCFQEAVTMIKPIEDAEESAKRLMQEAYGRGSADNITCVVVRFLTHHGTSTHSSSGGNNGTAHGTSGGNHGPSHGTSGGNHGTSHGSSGGNLGPSHGSSGVSHGTSHGNSGGIHGPSHGSSGGNHVTSSHGSSGGNHGPSSHGSSGGGNKNLPNAGYK